MTLEVINSRKSIAVCAKWLKLISQKTAWKLFEAIEILASVSILKLSISITRYTLYEVWREPDKVLIAFQVDWFRYKWCQFNISNAYDEMLSNLEHILIMITARVD